MLQVRCFLVTNFAIAFWLGGTRYDGKGMFRLKSSDAPPKKNMSREMNLHRSAMLHGDTTDPRHDPDISGFSGSWSLPPIRVFFPGFSTDCPAPPSGSSRHVWLVQTAVHVDVGEGPVPPADGPNGSIGVKPVSLRRFRWFLGGFGGLGRTVWVVCCFLFKPPKLRR